MAKDVKLNPGESTTVAGPVVIQVASETSARSIGWRIVMFILPLSVLLNITFLINQSAQSGSSAGVVSRHHSGSEGADAKLAVMNFSGTIMPPFTERWLKQIEAAREDDAVKGVLLAIDSPGGLVADSHQLYHELQKLKEQKPVYVCMKRMAASGGYYIAVAGGDSSLIFAEPTTWTGSIGVIIPRYNAAELGSKVGIKVEPLVTGPYKDSLNPFRDLTGPEQAVWDGILADSFERFVGVIADNRPRLDDAGVRELATGQIYTASQALANGMVDQIGYEEDALQALAESLKLSEYEVISYGSTPTLLDALLSSAAKQEKSALEQLLESSTPRAMYYCSWNPWIPTAP